MWPGHLAGMARAALPVVCVWITECVEGNCACIMRVHLYMCYSREKAGLSSNENVPENNTGTFKTRWCTAHFKRDDCCLASVAPDL